WDLTRQVLPLIGRREVATTGGRREVATRGRRKIATAATGGGRCGAGGAGRAEIGSRLRGGGGLGAVGGQDLHQPVAAVGPAHRLAVLDVRDLVHRAAIGGNNLITGDLHVAEVREDDLARLGGDAAQGAHGQPL